MPRDRKEKMYTEPWFRDVDTLFRQLYLFRGTHLVVALSPELRVEDIALIHGEKGELEIVQRTMERRGRIIMTLKLENVEEVKR
jgi:hypothetical protein